MPARQDESLNQVLRDVIDSAKEFALAEAIVLKARVFQLLGTAKGTIIIACLALFFLFFLIFFGLGTLASGLGTLFFHSVWKMWGIFTLVFLVLTVSCVLLCIRTAKSIKSSVTAIKADTQEELEWLKKFMTLKPNATSSENSSDHPSGG